MLAENWRIPIGFSGPKKEIAELKEAVSAYRDSLVMNETQDSDTLNDLEELLK